METARPLLLVLLALLVAFVAVVLVARLVGRRIARSREARALREAEPRVAERLAALRPRPGATEQARPTPGLVPPPPPPRPAPPGGTGWRPAGRRPGHAVRHGSRGGRHAPADPRADHHPDRLAALDRADGEATCEAGCEAPAYAHPPPDPGPAAAAPPGRSVGPERRVAAAILRRP